VSSTSVSVRGCRGSAAESCSGNRARCLNDVGIAPHSIEPRRIEFVEATAKTPNDTSIVSSHATTWSDDVSIFSKIMGAIFGSGSAQASTPATAPAPATPASTVDVAAIVDAAAKSKGEKLAWRTSIVDLMKALDLDSSLTARKELAKELKYTGDTNDSATMNVWLHKQIMEKLAANGGKLPDDIKS
jgi:hypothetical protein